MTLRKRLLISIMILTICASVLTGCGKGIKDNAATSINASKIVYDDLFKENEIMDVKIEISEDDWKDMLENAMDEEYHSVNITIGNNTLENVGIRTKGFSSLQSVASSDSDRYSFRVKLDKYVDGQNLNGLDEFVLNNNFQDPSYMREYLSYKALEQLGVDVPQMSYANIYINGELFGFYLAVEAIDDSFIERVSESDASDIKLYKADGENSTLVNEASLKSFDLKIGEDDNMDDLKRLVSAINSIEDGNKGEIESMFDVDTFLKAIAVNTTVGNYDSYSGSKAHNYFLLKENGVFKYIPWDFNMAFGGFMEDNGASVTVSIENPIYGVDSSERPLIEKLLSVDEYKERYYGYLKELVDYYDNFEEQVNDLASLIRPYIENDPTAFYTIEQFQQNIVESDIDLSTIENKKEGNMPKHPNNSNGEPSDMPEGMPMGNGENPGMPNGELPDMPNEMEGIEKPDMIPNDSKMEPPNMAGDSKMSNRGGGMEISENVVSIMDYLQQRIKNIKSQLN